MKEEITSKIKNLLIEPQKEMLKLLKPETRENARDNIDEEMENETRSFYSPTRSVRINSTQNDPNICRNNILSKTDNFCRWDDLNFVAKDPNFLQAECKVRSFVNMEVCPFGRTFQRIMIDFNYQSMYKI